MDELLKVGDRVKVKSYTELRRCYSGYFMGSDIKEYCDRYVTIKSRYIIDDEMHYTLVEDESSRRWLIDYFDLSTINYSNIIDSIKKYCSDYCFCDVCNDKCLLRGNHKLISKNPNLISPGDRIRVHSLEWFEKNSYFIETMCNSKGYIRVSSPLTSKIKNLCGKEIVISDIYYVNDIIYYKDGIIGCIWISEFFEKEDMKNIINNSLLYCDNFCILGNRDKCNNTECPLYSVKFTNGYEEL